MSIIWTPPTLADALCVEVEADAGEVFFDSMVIANAATVSWCNGRIDTETYLETIEQTLDVDPVTFVQEALDLYLPGIGAL